MHLVGLVHLRLAERRRRAHARAHGTEAEHVRILVRVHRVLKIRGSQRASVQVNRFSEASCRVRILAAATQDKALVLESLEALEAFLVQHAADPLLSRGLGRLVLVFLQTHTEVTHPLNNHS
eukprot:TRINITY_DN1069_c0_g1_i1.p2 TRINITY_DN1069_c0_g1~~TRINITY_DN1069_c0_g1_i1.p2  ORF type:complete len:122 (-),score=8.70 TRINITY_DN1069_c0_g1_i1:340-705(-)